MSNMGAYIILHCKQDSACFSSEVVNIVLRCLVVTKSWESSIQEGWVNCEVCFLSLMRQVGGFSGGNSEHLRHNFRFESLSKKSIFFRIVLQNNFSFSKRTEVERLAATWRWALFFGGLFFYFSLASQYHLKFVPEALGNHRNAMYSWKGLQETM